MDFEEKKAKLLSQLNKASGIEFSVVDTELTDEETINKLRELLLHFNTMENKSAFYKEYFTGELSASEAVFRLNRFHINDVENRFLFYMESEHPFTSEAIALLKSLRPNPKDEIIEMDERHIVIIFHLADDCDIDDILQTGNEIIAMMETEVYTTFKLSYDKPVNTFSQLLDSYKCIVLSMKIGSIFFAEERIYNFSELGLGRLLYNIPVDECLTYINNYISLDGLDSLDEETLLTLDAFFENDLSIAETSRKMFIHRNTLIYRLDKFSEATGLDVRKFNDAMTCKISLMLYSYIKSSN